MWKSPARFWPPGWGYPASGVVNQEWQQFTGRAVVNWTPKLNFTDQTLVYASFSRGYKAGGANPPPPNPLLGFNAGLITATSVTHPLTFAPEFVNAYEFGTKNTLLDGALTINETSSITITRATRFRRSSTALRSTSTSMPIFAVPSVETTWEPVPGLRFNSPAAGRHQTRRRLAGIDLMDRTAGHSGWLVVKPSVFSTSNCILPQYVVAELLGSGYLQSTGYGGGDE